MNLHRDIPASFHDIPPSDFSGSPEKKSVKRDVGIDAVFYGLRGKCPACKKAKLFGKGKKYWTMNATCPNCGVKYVREEGEYIVAMYINIILTQVLFVIGYFTTNYLFDLPATTQILIWGPFNFLFPVFFYPRSKGMWAGALHMMGGLYRD